PRAATARCGACSPRAATRLSSCAARRWAPMCSATSPTASGATKTRASSRLDDDVDGVLAGELTGEHLDGALGLGEREDVGAQPIERQPARVEDLERGAVAGRGHAARADDGDAAQHDLVARERRHLDA